MADYYGSPVANIGYAVGKQCKQKPCPVTPKCGHCDCCGQKRCRAHAHGQVQRLSLIIEIFKSLFVRHKTDERKDNYGVQPVLGSCKPLMSAQYVAKASRHYIVFLFGVACGQPNPLVPDRDVLDSVTWIQSSLGSFSFPNS